MKKEWENLMEKRQALKPGSQVARIPSHAHGDINHPEVEYGFVTEVKRLLGVAHVRYFTKKYPNELRNKANSEARRSRICILSTSSPNT